MMVLKGQLFQSGTHTAMEVVDLYLPAALLVSRIWTCLLGVDFLSGEVPEALDQTGNLRDQQLLGGHA